MNLSSLFYGRINRRNFALAYIPLLLVTYYISAPFSTQGLPKEYATLIPTLLLLFLFMILGISLTIRRFHDVGRSGWFILLLHIPIVSIFVLLYLLFKKGNLDVNTYGSPPQSRVDISDITPLIK